jgi:hypothetical protein
MSRLNCRNRREDRCAEKPGFPACSAACGAAKHISAACLPEKGVFDFFSIG